MTAALHVSNACAQVVTKLVDSLNAAIANLDNVATNLDVAGKLAPPAAPAPIHTFDAFDKTMLGFVLVTGAVSFVAWLYEHFKTPKAAIAAVQAAATKVETAVAQATKPLPTTVAQAKAQGVLADVESAAAKIQADIAKVL